MRPYQTTRFGLALFLVLSLSGIAAGSDSSPYSKEELRPGAVRTFEGRALDQIAFPLGGIGTGTIGLGGWGQLRDWEIQNRPAKGSAPRLLCHAQGPRRREAAPRQGDPGPRRRRPRRWRPLRAAPVGRGPAALPRACRSTANTPSPRSNSATPTCRSASSSRPSTRSFR